MRENSITRLQIENADVFLENLGSGKGKITILDTHMGAYANYWGAMGESLESFIISINSDYFAKKLGKNLFSFCPKSTVKNLRKAIKEELHWWEDISAQKRLRECIKYLELCSSVDEFIRLCITIPESLHVLELTLNEEAEFRSRIKDIFESEPWEYIEHKPSNEYKWLVKIHKKLQLYLKKTSQTTPQITA